MVAAGPQETGGRRQRRRRALRDKSMFSPDVTEITLLGVLAKENTYPTLLYCVTVNQPDQEICNISQWSSQILNASRSIFLGKILTLLRVTDPGRVEICYTDTDSVIYAASSEQFKDQLREEYKKHYEEIALFLFGDPESLTEQSGTFKVGWSPKAYLFGKSTNSLCFRLKVSGLPGLYYMLYTRARTLTHTHIPLLVISETRKFIVWKTRLKIIMIQWFALEAYPASWPTNWKLGISRKNQNRIRLPLGGLVCVQRKLCKS